MKTIFRAGLFAVLFISIFTLGKDIYEQVKKFEEIQIVESESKRLEDKNQSLKLAQESEKSSFNLEKQARDKLNYKKKGDTLYVVDLLGKEKQQYEIESDNWQKWVELFLK